MKKYSWYLAFIFWFILFSVVILWSISFLSSYFKLDEGGLIWFVVGLQLLTPYFLFAVFLLSIFKFVFDRFVKRYKSNLFPALCIGVASLIAVGPFIDVFGRVRDFYIADSAHVVLTYPWPFLFLFGLAVLKVSAAVLKIDAPQIWTEIISPAIITVSLLLIVSPFLIIGRQYVTDTGWLCFLSADDERKQECVKSKFIKSAEVEDCYDNDKGWDTNNCIYRMAVKKRDMAACNLLPADIADKSSSFWWDNYSERNKCFATIVFLSGEKRGCEAILHERSDTTCNELFERLAQEEQKEREGEEAMSFFEKVLEKMK